VATLLAYRHFGLSAPAAGGAEGSMWNTPDGA
jgi:Holliday junction DNA helicase RuvB